MIKLIVFDFDGVIVTGSNQGYFNCYHKALEGVGVTLDPIEERRRILERWGQSHRREIELLLLDHPDKVDEAVKIYDENFETEVYGDNIVLIDQAKQVLEELSKKYILTISSGADRASIDRMIQKFDLDYFKTIISGYDLKSHEQQKPSPYSIRALQAEFGAKNEETVMIGDGLTDVQMAFNAGVTPIVVLTGHLSRSDAEGLGVSHIIEGVKSLPTLLSSLSKV